MLSPALVPIFKDTPKATILKKPEWGLILDCKNRQKRIAQRLKDWDRSATCEVTKWNGSTIVGLKINSVASSVNLTKKVSFPKTGLYRIEIRVRKAPTDTGAVTLYDGSTQIEDRKSLNHKWGHYERIIYKTRKYNAGNHDLKLLVERSGYVEAIFIYPILRITAGSVPDQDSVDTLNVSKIDFTMNDCNELDSMNITASLKNSFWNGLNDSQMIFGWTDSVTLLIGETKTNLTPIWGGYIVGPVPSDDLSQLNIICVSRLLDMNRQPTYHDFAIGAAPATDDTQTQPYISFPNVYTLVEYLSTTAEYPINTAGIPIDYGMMVNFVDNDQFNSIQPGNFKKAYDIDFGHPKPCLKVTPGSIVGPTEMIMWQGDPWDAAYYQMFNLDYYLSGAGAKYPLQFDLQFTMHKAGETVNDAIDYIMRFTGADARNNIIGSYKQDIQSIWPSINFNLKNLLDKFAYSTQYNISKFSLVGTITQSQVDHPLCSAIWLDNIFSYSNTQQAPKHTSSGVNYPFDEIKDICDNTNHIVYVKPGIERKDDVIVVKPLETAITDEVLVEGKDGNVLQITNWAYDPIGNGFCNQAHRTFNFSENKSGSAYKEDWESIIDNGPFENHEFLDTINTQAAADQIATQYVQDHCHEKQAFSVIIYGTTLIEQAHYIMANITSGRIIGAHQIKTITQTLDFKNGIFKAVVDLNQPSLRFKYRIRAIKRALGLTDNRNMNTTYRQVGLNDLARSSPGAFINF